MQPLVCQAKQVAIAREAEGNTFFFSETCWLLPCRLCCLKQVYEQAECRVPEQSPAPPQIVVSRRGQCQMVFWFSNGHALTLSGSRPQSLQGVADYTHGSGGAGCCPICSAAGGRASFAARLTQLSFHIATAASCRLTGLQSQIVEPIAQNRDFGGSGLLQHSMYVAA